MNLLNMLNSSKVIQGELAKVRSSFKIRLPHDTGSDVSSGREGTSASGYSRRHHDSGIYIPHALPMVVLFLVLRRRGQCKPFRTKMLQRHSHHSPSATAHLIMDPHSPESRLLALFSYTAVMFIMFEGPHQCRISYSLWLITWKNDKWRKEKKTYPYPIT